MITEHDLIRIAETVRATIKAAYPQVLSMKTISELTGFSSKQLRKATRDGRIKSVGEPGRPMYILHEINEAIRNGLIVQRNRPAKKAKS